MGQTTKHPPAATKPLPPPKITTTVQVVLRANSAHQKPEASQNLTKSGEHLVSRDPYNMVYYNPVALVAGYHIEVRGVNGVNGCSSLKLGSTPMRPQPSIFPLSVLGSVVFVVTVPYRHPMVIVHSAYQTG